MIPIDVSRDAGLNLLFQDLPRRLVALQTAPAPCGTQDRLRLPPEDLAQLVFQEMGMDQERSARGPAQDQPRIPGEQDSGFPGSELHQVRVLDSSEIENVVPQDPQPSREPSQHAVRHEAHGSGVFDTPGSVC